MFAIKMANYIRTKEGKTIFASDLNSIKNFNYMKRNNLAEVSDVSYSQFYMNLIERIKDIISNLA